MEDLKSLVKRRAGVKQSLTRFKDYLERIDTENEYVLELKARLEKIKEKWDVFNEVQLKIELLESDDESGEQQREEFENSYFELICKAEKLIKLGEAQNAVEQRSLKTEKVRDEYVRLPPIELRQFSGKYEEWNSFFELFNSMIHKNKELSEVQKLYYLRASVSGSAADVISELDITSDNYALAIDLLKERYENRRLAIQTHIKTILESPAMTKENHLNLRKFLDNFKKHFSALKSLKSDAVTSQDLLTYLIITKLDSGTIKEWEGMQTRESTPTIEELINFLEHKCDTLEAVKRVPAQDRVAGSSRRGIQTTSGYSVTSISNSRCAMCNNENHNIANCDKFKALSLVERHKKVLEKGLCLNCLKAGNHRAKDCIREGCKVCSQKHNILLHDKFYGGKQHIASNHAGGNSQVLLSTAVVTIFDIDGKEHTCRVLLDCGSQADFITEEMARKLRLPTERVNISVVGIGQYITKTFQRVKVKVKSRINKYELSLKPLLLNNITEPLPRQSFPKGQIAIPKNILLADPNFNSSSKIDLLIGAQHFWNLILYGSRKIQGQPTLQNSKFGWILAGSWGDQVEVKTRVSNFVSTGPIDLSKFWEVKSIANPSDLTPEEKYCVEHFERTVKRNTEGRFIVELPIKHELLSQLKSNREIALRRFYNLEAKLTKNAHLKEEYVKFMRECIELGHMREITENEEKFKGVLYYIPHHCVINSNSLTTKLRVVFDASSKAQSSLSLNDILMAGPVLQQDLVSILIRFRTFRFVMVADIQKMYRQVRLAEQQTMLQRIFWREHPAGRLRVFELETLTYGTASASFLAVKRLQELAKVEASGYPLGTKIALRNFYVDELITGANTKDELKTIRDDMIEILKKGGFKLAKWCSNLPDIVFGLEPDRIKQVTFDKQTTFRTLGVKWWPLEDRFGYDIENLNLSGIITMREILSTIARIFDPLGLVGPYIIQAKIILPKIWELKLGWDEKVPENIQKNGRV